jgi:hypothetical protein
MRIVLRHTTTGLFLREEDQWTHDLDLARCFKHSAEAMDLARQTCLQSVEVLLSFEDPPRQIALPLP